MFKTNLKVNKVVQGKHRQYSELLEYFIVQHLMKKNKNCDRKIARVAIWFMYSQLIILFDLFYWNLLIF